MPLTETATEQTAAIAGPAGWGHLEATPEGFRVRLAKLAVSEGRFEWLDNAKGGARHWNFELLRNVLSDSLEKAGFPAKAKHVRACHRDFRGHRCRTGGHHWAVPAYTCHIRLCPFEMRARSVKAQRRFGSVIARLRDPRYMVLSERNCGLDNLTEGIAHLFASFNKLRRCSVWAKVRGCLVVLEITFNRNDSSWHPHLNVLLDGPFIPWESLRDAWLEATEGAGRQAYIQRADLGTARELLKYITKLVEFVDVPEAVREFLLATQGKRFIRTYGTLFGREIDTKEVRVRQCPDCGSTDVEDLGIVTRDRIYWDHKGIPRFVPPKDWPGP